jgi:capsular polysaccharide biosynthesis protein
LLIPGSGLLGSDFLVLSERNNIFTDSTWSIPGFLDSNDATGILLYPRIRYCPEAYGILGIRLWEAYYHWMIEILPRLSLFEQIEELRSIPLIVPKGMKNFHKESLKLAGVSSDRLVELDSGYWQFEKLYFPSLLNEMANPSPHAVAWLRTRFLKNITHEPSSQSYIYMKRGSQIRKIVNEDELVECLEKRGFQVVCPGELSLAEQIKIFSNARIVVGAHGADFTNMVFAPPNTTIIELHPSRYIIPCFWGLASLCRHRYAYLIGPSVSNENYGGLTNFYISLDKLQMLLDKVMNME